MSFTDYPKGVDVPSVKPLFVKPKDGILRGKFLRQTVPEEEMYVKDQCPVEIVPRENWTSIPPKDVEAIIPPLTHVRFTDTDTEQCKNREDCISMLRDLQKKHMDEGLNDIKHNFMIDSEGTVYEGRGWHAEATRPDEDMGQILTGLKGHCVDIAYIGTFDRTMSVEVPWEMLASAFHFTHWASKHDLLADMFGITQLRIPDFVNYPF